MSTSAISLDARNKTMNAWEQIKLSLATKISTEAFQNWLVKTSFRQMDGDIIWVGVPNEATREWIESEYAECVRTAIRELNLPIRQINYELSSRNPICR
jgi:ATPase involved in DNA replication initiation